MTKNIGSNKEENLTPGKVKEINMIEIGERIYREPQNFDHVELTCIGEEGNYKIFQYSNYGGEFFKVKIKKSDLIEVWYDNCWHVKGDIEVIPCEG